MSIINHILDLLAPHECLGCKTEADLLCADCIGELTGVPERCYRCLAPSAGSLTCAACSPTSHLNRVFAATPYDGVAKELVIRLKFNGARAAVRSMSAHMARRLEGVDAGTVIVPIPTAAARARGRGFDQAKLLAKGLSRRTGLPYLDCLVRRGSTRQVGTSRELRLRQLEGAFHVRTVPRHARVILLDDVLTTGATLESAAQALHAQGMDRIMAAVFAQA